MRRTIARGLVTVLAASLMLGGMPPAGRAEELTNARVMELSRLGLGDDIIIAKIHSGRPKFQLADSDLLDLKRARVSDRVIAAMLEGNVVKEVTVTIDGKVLERKTLAQAKVGGRLGRMATMGLKSQKKKAYIQGAFSEVTVSANPRIELELPEGENANSFALVRLDPREDRRELEVASVGGIVGEKEGLRAEAIVATNATPIGSNRFRLELGAALMPGEYMLYVIGSADATKGIHGEGYDFGVR